MSSANRVLDDYSGLNDEEKAEFDRRYKDMMKFRRQMDGIVKAFVKAKKAEKSAPEQETVSA